MHFKKNFITGLITILPLWLTLLLAWLIVKWVSGLAMPFLSPLLNYYFNFPGEETVIRIISFTSALFAIWFIGLAVTHMAASRFLSRLERVLGRIPLLRSIYSAMHKLIQYLFIIKKDFQSVVLVEFPRKGSYSVGFVTGHIDMPDRLPGSMASVLVPTVPNVTSGFLVFISREELIPLDLTAEEAIRLIMTGGIIPPDKWRDTHGSAEGEQYGGPLPRKQH